MGHPVTTGDPKQLEEPVVCPLTGSRNVSRIRTYPVDKLVADWEERFSLDIRGEFEGISEIGMWMSHDTGLLFFVPAHAAGSSRLYAGLQAIEGYYRPNRWEHEFALGCVRAGQRILEVGCGIGAFVEAGRGMGLDITGIEINEEAVAEAQVRGLPVTSTPLADFAARSPQSVDVLCGFQVLEHTPEPRRFIEACLAIVKPGGRIVFGVPNAEGFLKYYHEPLDLPPHHMVRWSAAAFKSLERIFPVRLERVGYEPLQEWHVDVFVESLIGRMRPYGLAPMVDGRRVQRLAAKIVGSRLRERLRGHTICAVLECRTRRDRATASEGA
jgi:2-polyprenyl-3-methyl-5-hydroxy-6-metoxy-1,4-benzoquinol methylase